MSTEKTLEKRLKREVEKQGGLALKIWSVSVTGLPDRMILMPGGKIRFVETKSRTGKLSPRQIRMHKILERLGFDVHTIATDEQLLSFLTEIK